MSLRVERQLDANGYLTGRANAMVRVFGFIQKQVPLESQMTITSPTTAQGEGLGNHWTLTVDPQTGTSEAVVRHDDTHQVTMRVTGSESVSRIESHCGEREATVKRNEGGVRRCAPKTVAAKNRLKPAGSGTRRGRAGRALRGERRSA
eukprot:1829019-Prymnesium_polylepis.1